MALDLVGSTSEPQGNFARVERFGTDLNSRSNSVDAMSLGRKENFITQRKSDYAFMLKRHRVDRKILKL